MQPATYIAYLLASGVGFMLWLAFVFFTAKVAAYGFFTGKRAFIKHYCLGSGDNGKAGT